MSQDRPNDRNQRADRPYNAYEVVPTNETGLNTGNRRYFVRCLACQRVLHEATTGPTHRIESHERSEYEDCAADVARIKAAAKPTQGINWNTRYFLGDADGRLVLQIQLGDEGPLVTNEIAAVTLPNGRRVSGEEFLRNHYTPPPARVLPTPLKGTEP